MFSFQFIDQIRRELAANSIHNAYATRLDSWVASASAVYIGHKFFIPFPCSFPSHFYVDSTHPEPHWTQLVNTASTASVFERTVHKNIIRPMSLHLVAATIANCIHHMASMFSKTFYHPRSEGGIVFSSVRLCLFVCLSVCLLTR